MTKQKMIKCCYGISSKADNNNGHIFMIDYDGIGIDSVIDHLKQVQKEFNLSDIFVIKSTNGYNALSLDILFPSLIYSIGVSVESPADRNFFKYGFDRGYYTLRMDQDKTLHSILYNKSMTYDKSMAHKLFLEWFFDIYIDSDYCFNDNKTLNIIQYPSGKDGYHFCKKSIPSYLARGV